MNHAGHLGGFVMTGLLAIIAGINPMQISGGLAFAMAVIFALASGWAITLAFSP